MPTLLTLSEVSLAGGAGFSPHLLHPAAFTEMNRLGNEQLSGSAQETEEGPLDQWWGSMVVDRKGREQDWAGGEAESGWGVLALWGGAEVEVIQICPETE